MTVFPSYQPIEHDPTTDFHARQHAVKNFHYISTILEKLLIESAGYQTNMDFEQNRDKGGKYDKTREEAKFRAYRLLESFYERCNEANRKGQANRKGRSVGDQAGKVSLPRC